MTTVHTGVGWSPDSAVRSELLVKATNGHRSDVTRLHRDHGAATQRTARGFRSTIASCGFRDSAFKHGVQIERTSSTQSGTPW